MSTTDAATGEDKELNRLIGESVSQGLNRYASMDASKSLESTKLFGLFEMDKGLASMIDGLYGAFVGQFSQVLSPRTFQALSSSFRGLDEMTRNRLAGAGTMAVNVGLYTLPHAGSVIAKMSSQQQANENLARRLAPVLKEIKGKHGYGAYLSVGVDDNEMIAAYRKRMSKINDTTNVRDAFGVLIKILPNLVLAERESFEALRTGRHRQDIVNQKKLEYVANEEASYIAGELNKQSGAQKGAPGHLKSSDVTADHVQQLLDADNDHIMERLGKLAEGSYKKKKATTEGLDFGLGAALGINVSLPSVVDQFLKTSELRMKRDFSSPYTALEMVLTLEEQMATNPRSASFQLPGKGRALPLEAYVAEIIVQHQRDMSDMNAQYNPIRDALKGDVVAAAKVVANALREGQVSTLSLVHLIGEGKIIKNRGLGIASVEEIKSMLERQETKVATEANHDPKEYLKEASFTLEHLKTALDTVQGEEKLALALVIPQSILVAAGMSENDAQALKTQVAEHYDHRLAELVVALHSQSEELLHQRGLGQTEIAQLNTAYQALTSSGEKGLQALKSTPSNANGIERVVANFAVPQILADRVYFGKMLEESKQALPGILEKAAQPHEAARPARGTHAEKHRPEPDAALEERPTRGTHAEKHRPEPDVAMDEDFDHEASFVEEVEKKRSSTKHSTQHHTH